MSPAPGGTRWRGWAVLLGKLAISATLMAILVSRVPIDQVATSLREADPRWLLGAGTLLIASNTLGSFQWSRLLVAAGIRIPFWKVCAYYHVGLFFNNFLPANVGGDIARVMDAARYGPSRGAAISAVIMDRLIGTVSLAGLALVTTLPGIDEFHFTVAYAALVAFFAVSVFVLWSVFHPALLPTLGRGMARLGIHSIQPHLEDMADRFRGFRRGSLLAGLLAVGTVVQLARVGVHVLVGQALGLQVPLLYFFLFVPLLAVIVSVPISLNGIGLREGAGVILFGLVGVDRAGAFSLQFTTYLVAVAVSLLGGMVFLARIPRRAAAARNQRRAT